MSRLAIVAPMTGWCAPLDEIPDPVFAQRMLGDGVAIDPTEGALYAPCDGEVIAIAPTRHAVTLRAQNGAELVLHVGVDTVALAGEGFTAHTGSGAHVRAGELLLEFDLDVLAGRARSLLTPIIVTNGERFELAAMRVGYRIERGEVLFELIPRTTHTEPVRNVVVGTHSGTVGTAEAVITVTHGHGVHARPAALIASFAKRAGAEITLRAHGRSADARSAVSLMSLGVRKNDVVQATVRGERAAQVLRELQALITGLVDDPRPTAPVSTATPPREQRGDKLQGVIASRGLAAGRAARLHAATIEVEEAGRGVAFESAELERARTAVRTRLEQLSRTASGPAQAVMAAHLEFLDDCELTAAARGAIASGKSAGFAWRSSVRASVETLRSLGDAHLVERVDDLLDLESQVLLTLRGDAPVAQCELPEHSMLIAEDLKPSQFVALDASKLAGVCLAAGGPTSHVAILAAAVGVPMVVAFGPSLLDVQEGEWVVLDADHGTLKIAPDAHARAAVEQTLAAREQRRRDERAAAHRDARTADGTRIEVFSNLGAAVEAQLAVAQGAEGCGLLRTEFLFLDRERAPSEEEQLQVYQTIADALGARPLILRTLDIGGDKPLAYLSLPPEPNPALGLRGVRTSLWRPDLLRTQLRAALRVRAAGELRLLLPMITDVAEVRAVRRMLEEAAREVGSAGAVQLGAMIETPASALLAERIAREVDFFSIGTNDLTQYTLAMDRGHQELAHRIDALHPAVLQLIATAVAGAEKHQRLVAVCGGLASDPAATALLIGLGVRELSVVPMLVPHIKSVVRSLTLASSRELAAQALELENAEAVRALVNRHVTVESETAS